MLPGDGRATSVILGAPPRGRRWDRDSAADRQRPTREDQTSDRGDQRPAADQLRRRGAASRDAGEGAGTARARRRPATRSSTRAPPAEPSPSPTGDAARRGPGAAGSRPPRSRRGDRGARSAAHHPAHHHVHARGPRRPPTRRWSRTSRSPRRCTPPRPASTRGRWADERADGGQHHRRLVAGLPRGVGGGAGRADRRRRHLVRGGHRASPAIPTTAPALPPRLVLQRGLAAPRAAARRPGHPPARGRPTRPPTRGSPRRSCCPSRCPGSPGTATRSTAQLCLLADPDDWRPGTTLAELLTDAAAAAARRRPRPRRRADDAGAGGRRGGGLDADAPVAGRRCWSTPTALPPPERARRLGRPGPVSRALAPVSALVTLSGRGRTRCCGGARPSAGATPAASAGCACPTCRPRASTAPSCGRRRPSGWPSSSATTAAPTSRTPSRCWCPARARTGGRARSGCCSPAARPKPRSLEALLEPTEPRPATDCAGRPMGSWRCSPAASQHCRLRGAGDTPPRSPRCGCGAATRSTATPSPPACPATPPASPRPR